MSVAVNDALIATAAQAVFCEVAGEAVILDVASGRYFALNPIGTAIWRYLATPCTVVSVCQKLLAEYAVSPEQCEADVTALIDQLAEHGLVTRQEQAAG